MTFDQIKCICYGLTISLAVSSCITFRYIDIQVLNPAKIQAPHNIDSLYILDNQSSSIAKNQQTGSCYQGFAITLKQKLNESPIFQNVNITILPLNRVNSFNVNEEADTQVYYVMPSVKVLEEKIQSRINPDLDMEIEEGVLNFRFNVTTINSRTKDVYDYFIKYDTLIWEKSKSSDKYEIPKKVLFQIGQITAESYAQRFAPWWKTEERVLFYSPNHYMKKGYNSMINNDLLSASESWEHLYNVGANYLASMAAYNLALISEFQDDLEQSEQWLNKSLAAKKRSETQVYLELIKMRKALKDTLDKQMLKQLN